MSFFCLYKIPLILEVQFFFLTQLIILLGKYHIHAKKWAKAKPKCEHFLKEIKQYGITLQILETEKRKRPMKHYVSLIWLIKYFYFFTWQRFVFYLFRNFIFCIPLFIFFFVFVILFYYCL